MSREEFRDQVDCATALIEKWPDWKQRILNDSSRPTIPIPRKPVVEEECAEISDCSVNDQK